MKKKNKTRLASKSDMVIGDKKEVIEEEKTISTERGKQSIWINVGIFIIIMIPFIMFGHCQHKALEKNGEYTNAVIDELDMTSRSARRGSALLYYSFFVDGIKYKGKGRLYPKRDTFCVGDTIAIIYEKTNPRNNAPERDFIHWFAAQLGSF